MAELCQPTNCAGRDLGCFAGQGISVIIPARADTALLRRAMWSVRQTAELRYELVVSPGEESVAANRNACLDRASQDLVAFVDDDVLLPAGWMSGLIAVLAQPGIGAVSAWLTFADGAPQMRGDRTDGSAPWRTTIPGTCFVYSRARVGDQRFDESYLGSQWEDTDWMWSVQRRGLSTVVARGVWVVHEHVRRTNPWLEHNMAHFHAKWGRLPEPEEVATIGEAQLALWRQPPLPGQERACAPL